MFLPPDFKTGVRHGPNLSKRIQQRLEHRFEPGFEPRSFQDKSFRVRNGPGQHLAEWNPLIFPSQKPGRQRLLIKQGI